MEAQNLYEQSINEMLPKDIPFTLKEREFLLVGMLLQKAEKDFFKQYELMSHAATEQENLSEEFIHTYNFMRDGSLVLEALLERMQKILNEHGTMGYDFSKYGEALNTTKGGHG